MSQNHTDLSAPMPDDGIVELPATADWSLTAQLTKVEPSFLEVRVLPPTTEGLVLHSTRRLRFPTKAAAKAFWSQLAFAPAELHRESRAGSLVLRNLKLALSNKSGEVTVSVRQGLYANV